MLDTKKYTNCDFGEQLVSYLYDEIDSSERSRFENHLDSCNTCLDELSAFSFTRDLVGDWREADFSHLPTPHIEIPHGIANTPEIASAKLPWYAPIRDLFSLSPAWMTAAAGLLISFGLVAALIGIPGAKQDLSQANTAKISGSPTKEIPVNTPLQTTPDKIDTANSGNKLQDAPAEITNKKTPKEVYSPTKVSHDSNQTKSPNSSQVKQTVQKPGKKSSKVNSKNTNRRAPRLIDEEEEDDSLRLSDILEEVSMR